MTYECGLEIIHYIDSSPRLDWMLLHVGPTTARACHGSRVHSIEDYQHIFTGHEEITSPGFFVTGLAIGRQITTRRHSDIV